MMARVGDEHDPPCASARPGATRDLAVLEGFHALKHALRFGAELVEAVAVDPAALEALARGAGARPGRAAGRPGRAVDAETLAELVPLAAAHRRRRDRPPARGRPRRDARRPSARRRWSCSRSRATWATSAPASGSPPRPTPPRCSPPARTTPGTPTPCAAPPACTSRCRSPRSRRCRASDRPLLAIDPEGEELRPGPAARRARCSPSAPSATASASELLERADARVAIPMREGVSSLNLATSVAAVLFAARLAAEDGFTIGAMASVAADQRGGDRGLERRPLRSLRAVPPHRHRRPRRARRARAARCTRPQPGERALDIGCGFGDTDAAHRRAGRARGRGARRRRGRALHRGRPARRPRRPASATSRFVRRRRRGDRVRASTSTTPSRAWARCSSPTRCGAAQRARGARARAAGSAWSSGAASSRTSGCTAPSRWSSGSSRSPRSYDEPTCGPGPFSMADADTTSEILLSAGFEDVALRRCDIDDPDRRRPRRGGRASRWARPGGRGDPAGRATSADAAAAADRGRAARGAGRVRAPRRRRGRRRRPGSSAPKRLISRKLLMHQAGVAASVRNTIARRSRRIGAT